MYEKQTSDQIKPMQDFSVLFTPEVMIDLERLSKNIENDKKESMNPYPHRASFTPPTRHRQVLFHNDLYKQQNDKLVLFNYLDDPLGEEL